MSYFDSMVNFNFENTSQPSELKLKSMKAQSKIFREGHKQKQPINLMRPSMNCSFFQNFTGFS
jgi:hypothetical protein